MTPEDRLKDLVDRLHEGVEPDIDAISEVGTGELEALIEEHGQALWPEIERLARADPVFRRALRSVWAYDSPEFERRHELLRELGEHWPVTLRFVVEPQDFLPEPRLTWRSIELEGEVPAGQLPRLLREIADWYEHERGHQQRPYVATMGNQWPVYYEWCKARWSLDRAWHRAVVSGDAASFRAAKEAVDAARLDEQARWRAFVYAMGYRDTTET